MLKVKLVFSQTHGMCVVGVEELTFFKNCSQQECNEWWVQLDKSMDNFFSALYSSPQPFLAPWSGFQWKTYFRRLAVKPVIKNTTHQYAECSGSLECVFPSGCSHLGFHSRKLSSISLFHCFYLISHFLRMDFVILQVTVQPVKFLEIYIHRILA